MLTSGNLFFKVDQQIPILLFATQLKAENSRPPRGLITDSAALILKQWASEQLEIVDKVPVDELAIKRGGIFGEEILSD